MIAGDGSVKPSLRGWLAVATASAATFIVLVDDSAVALSLSTIGEDLQLALADLQWVVNSYTLAFAVLALWGGMLADRLGSRRVLCAGLAAFAIASLAAGMSSGALSLVSLRAVQGASAAFIAPAALAAVTSTFPPGRRGLALGVWTGVGAIAIAAGPLVGAILTQTLGWRAIFLVNVPLCVVLIVAARLTLPRSARQPIRGRLDVAGLVTSAAGLSAFILALTQATSDGWTSGRPWAWLALSTASLAAFVVIERRSANPLLDLSLFTIPNFAVGNLLSMLILAIMCSLFFFLALFLQRGLLLEPVAAGLALLPFTAVIATIAPFAGRLSERTGPRVLIVSGLGLVAGGLAMLAAVGAESGASGMAPGLVTVGVGLGLASAPVTTAALALVPAGSTGSASATISVSRLVGLAIGVAAMGAIVSVGWPSGAVDTAADRSAFATALGTGFLLSAALALLGSALALVAVRSPRAQMKSEGTK